MVAITILTWFSMCILLGIQYTMVIADWRHNRSETWEKIVGIIPMGPYVLMLLTAVWYILKRIFKR